MFLWISQDFADLPEFRGSTTAWNIRSPDLCQFGELFWQQSCHPARRKGRGCTRQKCGLHTGLLFLGPFSLPNGVSAAKNFPRTHTSEPACRLPLVFYIILCYNPGADPGFFLGGGALVSCSTSTPINHIVFFCRIPVVLENRRSSQGGGVRTPCTLPLDPPL